MTIRRRNKSGTYYFRFFWQNKEFSRSLFTKDYHEARKTIKELENLVMAKVKNKTNLTAYEVNRIFDDYFIDAKTPKTPQAQKSKIERLKYYRDNNKINDLDIGIITELKLLRNMLSQAITPQTKQENIKKLNSLKKQITPLIPEYSEIISQENAYTILNTQLQLAEHDRKNFGIVESVQYANVSLRKALELFMTSKKADNLRPLSYEQLGKRIELMLNLLSNYDLSLPINSFGMFDYEKLQNLIYEYPANANQRSVLLDYIQVPERLIEVAKENGIKSMSLKTANDHLRELNTFLNYCVKKQLLQRNHLFFTARAKKSKKNTRKPYNHNDIKNLLESPIFTDKFHKTMAKKQEWIWIILLAMFSGARLTEICQLRVSDIDMDNKTISIQETDDEDNSLKNLNSTRVIPIADFIIECGFFGYVLQQRNNHANETVLWGWEKTKLVEKYGWGRYFGKRFNEYNRAYVTGEEHKSFHSFRHTVITYLNNKHPELNIVTTRFVGHAPESINLKVYTHTEWEEKMRTLANLIAYPQNMEPLDKLRNNLMGYYGAWNS